MAFNNLFCLLRPEVHTLSIGPSRPTDFDEHIRSLGYWTDAPCLISEIDARLRAALAEPLGADWARGIPRWEEIPGGVNVWEILRLLVLAQALDMVAFGKMRYNLLGQGGHWFPGKNAAEFDEQALRAAVSASPLADRIPGLLREAHELFFDKPVERLGRD
jgi:predicted aldo/keto reductase-like oxidoreductase